MIDPTTETGRLPPPEEPARSEGDAITSELEHLEQQARAFVREHPGLAVVAAVGLGYLLARLVSRGDR